MLIFKGDKQLSRRGLLQEMPNKEASASKPAFAFSLQCGDPGDSAFAFAVLALAPCASFFG